MPKDCGCEIANGLTGMEIIFCPLHAAAESTKWQRDELLAALEGMMHHHDHDPVGWPQAKCGRCTAAMQAIQRAKEEAHDA